MSPEGTDSPSRNSGRRHSLAISIVGRFPLVPTLCLIPVLRHFCGSSLLSGVKEEVVCLGAPLAGSHAARRLAELGGKRLLGASSEALLDGLTSRLPDDLEVGVIAGRLRLGLGMLLGGLPHPHDGVVAVEETLLEGVVAYRVFPVNHYSMTWSRAVSDQVIHFLRTGRFSEARGAGATGGEDSSPYHSTRNRIPRQR